MDERRSGTFGDRLRHARRRRFVGRTGEIELFRGALGAAEHPSFSVLFLYGPGGIGKSALLAELTEAAREEGAEPVVLDARTIAPQPPEFLAAVRRTGNGRQVLMLDTYELLAPLDDWLREHFLPGLPADALVVIAGRDAPSPRWAADPGWRELLRVISLRNLKPADSQAYLRIEGVPAELHEQIVRMTHGHPLALSLTVDMIGKQRQAAAAVPAALADTPDIVRALLGRMIDQVPSARHTAALQVCAHARFTTEELLRALLGGDDAPQLFSWLRALSFIEEGPYGLYPHDVARDILEADLRWRQPVEYAALHHRLHGHFVERIRRSRADGPADRQLLADFLYLTRGHPVISSYWELTEIGGLTIAKPGPDDLPTLLDLTERLQGEEQAGYAAYWMERQPGAFGLYQDAATGETFGYAAYLALHEASAADRAADPGTRAMWEYVQRAAPPRPGESVLAWRFFVDTEAGRRPSRSETLTLLWHGRELITRDGRAWDLVAVPSDRAYFDPLLEFFDFQHVPEACFAIGGRAFDVYAHDWRRRDVESWLELTADRELGTAVTAPPAEPELVLSQPEFAGAVRDALRDLRRADRLAGNPLLRSRLIRQAAAGADAGGRAEVLRGLIAAAAQTLRTDPREEPLFRVIDRTFLRPAPTQERAAELLGLPFSTYRRYRNRGVERIVDWLWQRELYGHQLDT